MKDEDDLIPHLAGYVSVREAAEFLGVSERTVYGYINEGQLKAVRAGGGIAIREQVVKDFDRQGTGRPRTRQPAWRLPVGKNVQYLLTIFVPLLPDKEEAFEARLKDIYRAKKHLLPGTVARYIALTEESPVEVQIVLLWRSTVMPKEAEREAALQALRADFTGILDWQQARSKYSRVMMNT